MRRFGLIAGMGALAVVVFLLAGQLYRKSQECDRQRARIETLYTQAKTLQRATTRGKQQADSLRVRLTRLAPSPIHPLDIGYLRKRGLENPIEDLVANLQQHAEIIPHPGVSGGRMGFYDADRIRVLSDSWVYAPFDDGHVGGEALLEYEVAPGGSITWRVLESRMR